MNQKELKELIEFLIEKDIAEFELERGDVKVRIKRAAEKGAPADGPHFVMHPAPVVAQPVIAQAVPLAAAPAPPAQPAAPPPEPEEQLVMVRSPIVGTFYESPSPGAPPFVQVGDSIEEGQVLCIVEAMKLMNEIESDASGIIVKKLVSNGQPIEYGQDLFAVRPRK
jgi:acetyl-CoA carboxylase biotin carboxyl carrier protein